jgi:translation initiation factor IF-2
VEEKVEEKKIPVKEVSVYIKADSNGAIEALQKSLAELPADEEINLRILKTGVGTVSESDMLLAQTAKGAILAFAVPTVKSDLATAVPIFASKIIYEILNNFQVRQNVSRFFELISLGLCVKVFNTLYDRECQRSCTSSTSLSD